MHAERTGKMVAPASADLQAAAALEDGDVFPMEEGLQLDDPIDVDHRRPVNADKPPRIERLNEAVLAARAVIVGVRERVEAEALAELLRTKVNLLPKGLTTVRTVEIAGLDLQADGGTHVANTREVGTVRITRVKNKGRENKRLYIEIQDRGANGDST